MRKQTQEFISIHWFAILVVAIMIISIILRFANYPNRYGLAYDQAHDAIIARYSITAHKLPLLGPFSSAGPFQTGGEWYWIIMIGTAIFPFSVVSPWIFITLIYVLFVYLMIRFGTYLVSKKFGLLLGALTAVSTAQITQGTNLTNQSPIAILSLLVLWFCIRFMRGKKATDLFFAGFCVSLAASIHLQGVGLVLIILSTFLATRFYRPKEIGLLIVGAVLPLLPILISDAGHNFYNVKNMLQYYLHDQQRIPLETLGRRWSTYLLVFWPQSWGLILGGIPVIGAILAAGGSVGAAVIVFKKKSFNEWGIIFLSLAGMVTLLRYTHTPLFDSYLVFTHPFVLLISTLFLYEIARKNSAAGIFVFIIVILGSLSSDANAIQNATNHTAKNASYVSSLLYKKYPGKSFTLYDYQYKTTAQSLPLVLFLQTDGKISNTGVEIGVAGGVPSGNAYPVLGKDMVGNYILDLSSAPTNSLSKSDWSNINPNSIYHATEDWFQRD